MPEYSPGASGNLPAQTGNVDVPDIKLTEISSEPRARDLDVGKRLGFTKPVAIRKLIERHAESLAEFGVISTVEKTSGRAGGRPALEYWLNEAQALYIASKSETENANAVLMMLIRVFVAWRRGHLTTAPDAVLAAGRGLSKGDIAIIGNVVKNCTGVVIREQLAELLPQMLTSAVASIGSLIAPGAPAPMIRQGRTAGQIWNAHGFPRLRSTAWFGNRLTEMGCGIYGRGELGDNRARLFDPDKASDWIKGGGRRLIEGYVKERAGQGKLEGM